MRWFIKYYDPETPPGAAAAVIEPAASAATTLPLPPANDGKTPPAAAAPAAPSFVIPDSYKDKPYLKGIDSSEKVFAMLDGAQNLIGKRPAGIPAPDAKPEEWDKFYEAVGRPKEAKEYVFDGADKADPKFLPRIQTALHKAGLNPTQAKVVWSEVNAALSDFAKDKGLADQQQNIDFDKLGADTFGPQRDAILASSKVLIDKFTPPNMKTAVSQLSNENLILLAGVVDGIKKTYIKEEGPGSQPATTGMSPSDIQAKARELMLKPEYSDPFKPGHEVVKKQVDDLYNLLRKK